MNLYRLGWFDGFSWLYGLRLLDRLILPQTFGLPFCRLALRVLNIENVGKYCHLPAPLIVIACGSRSLPWAGFYLEYNRQFSTPAPKTK
ncbi:MAG: hypothetical protein ABSC01_12555 [Verrucomicrobiota bacterium]